MDKLLKGQHVRTDEHWGLLGVLGVEGVFEDLIAHAVVEVGTWGELDVVVLDGLVEVLDQGGIGPCLVGGVGEFSDSPTHKAGNNAIFTRCVHFGPLFELDNHGGVFGLVVLASQDEVDTLGGQWDAIFDGDASIIRYLAADQDVVHVLHGVSPGLDFVFGRFALGVLFKGSHDLLLNLVGKDIGGELGFGGGVDDHSAFTIQLF